MDFIYLHTCLIIRMIRPDPDQTHFCRHYPIVLNLDSAKCVHIKQFFKTDVDLILFPLLSKYLSLSSLNRRLVISVKARVSSS